MSASLSGLMVWGRPGGKRKKQPYSSGGQWHGLKCGRLLRWFADASLKVGGFVILHHSVCKLLCTFLTLKLPQAKSLHHQAADLGQPPSAGPRKRSNSTRPNVLTWDSHL